MNKYLIKPRGTLRCQWCRWSFFTPKACTTRDMATYDWPWLKQGLALGQNQARQRKEQLAMDRGIPLLLQIDHGSLLLHAHGATWVVPCLWRHSSMSVPSCDERLRYPSHQKLTREAAALFVCRSTMGVNMVPRTKTSSCWAQPVRNKLLTCYGTSRGRSYTSQAMAGNRSSTPRAYAFLTKSTPF